MCRFLCKPRNYFLCKISIVPNTWFFSFSWFLHIWYFVLRPILKGPTTCFSVIFFYFCAFSVGKLRNTASFLGLNIYYWHFFIHGGYTKICPLNLTHSRHAKIFELLIVNYHKAHFFQDCLIKISGIEGVYCPTNFRQHFCQSGVRKLEFWHGIFYWLSYV